MKIELDKNVYYEETTTHLWHVKSSKTKNNIDNRLEPDERRHVYNYIGNENGYEVILISNEMLYECKDCRVVRDPQTLKSKGYGFVSFVKKSANTSQIIIRNSFIFQCDKY
ncbi:hypothetical protein GQX74_013069 [Glossina fuscipes]|nr:hypothetical protein GQX74_013069 [Glossina fuscipes]